MTRIQRLVDELTARPTAAEAQQQLDHLIAQVYGLTMAEQAEVGMEQ